jgi:hypothetical protein
VTVSMDKLKKPDSAKVSDKSKTDGAQNAIKKVEQKGVGKDEKSSSTSAVRKVDDRSGAAKSKLTSDTTKLSKQPESSAAAKSAAVEIKPKLKPLELARQLTAGLAKPATVVQPARQHVATPASVAAASGPDPARIGVRQSLREVLFACANESDDIMLSSGEIKQLALDIENEMFRFYGGMNEQYRLKYQSLLADTKDQKQAELFRKILNAQITPAGLFMIADTRTEAKVNSAKPSTATVSQQVCLSLLAIPIGYRQFIAKSVCLFRF